MLTGINHHLQSVVFGCALLTDFTKYFYVWFIQNWIAAMGAHHPISLSTSYDEAIGSTVAKVFPKTYHILRYQTFARKIWLISILDVLLLKRNLECINEPETTEIFKSCWKKILDKYDVDENLWLQSLYRIRQEWVHVYFKDVFTGELSATQRPEILRSFFKKDFNNPSSTSLFENVMTGWAEKESLEDLATFLPCLL